MPNIPVAIVAVPSNADALPGSEEKHCTLQYLGTIGDTGAPTLEDSLPAVLAAVSQAAATLQPFSLPVDRVGELGNEGAKVWFLDDQDMRMHELKAQVLSPEVVALVEAGTFTKYPDFTPHVTIGYGAEVPAAAKDVESIAFYALSLWWGDQRIEFPLGALAHTAALERTQALAIVDILGNWHHPHTGKFIRKPWEFDLTLKALFPEDVQNRVDQLSESPAGTFKEDVYRLRKYLRELGKNPGDFDKLNQSWAKVDELRARYSLAFIRNFDGGRAGAGNPKQGLPNMDAVDAVMDLVEEGLEFLETANMYETHGVDPNPDQEMLPLEPPDWDDEFSTYSLEQQALVGLDRFTSLMDVVHDVRRPATATFKKQQIDGSKLSAAVTALSGLGDTKGARHLKNLAKKGDKAGLNNAIDGKVATLEKTAADLEVFITTDPSDYENPFKEPANETEADRSRAAKKGAASKTASERSAAAEKAAETRAKSGKEQKRAPAGTPTGGQFVDDPATAARNVGGGTSGNAIQKSLAAGNVTKAQKQAEAYLNKVNNALDSLYNITFASRTTELAINGSFAIIDRIGNWHSPSTGKFIDKPWKVASDLWFKLYDEKTKKSAMPAYLDSACAATEKAAAGNDAEAIMQSGVKLEEAIDRFEDELPLSTDDEVVGLLDKLRDGAWYLQKSEWWPDLPEESADKLPDAASDTEPSAPPGLDGISVVRLSDGSEIYDPSSSIRRLQQLLKEKVPGTWVGLAKAANGVQRSAAAGDLAGAQEHIRVVAAIMKYARDVNGLGEFFDDDPAIRQLEVEIDSVADDITEADLPNLKGPNANKVSGELSRIAKEMTHAVHDPLLAGVLVGELEELIAQMSPRDPQYAVAQSMLARLRRGIGVTVGSKGPGTQVQELATTAHGTTVRIKLARTALAASGATEEAPMPNNALLAKWEGPLGFEGQLTGDNRLIAPGALAWADEGFPQPLRWAAEDIGAHDGARVIGTIEGMSRLDEPMEWSGQTLPAGTIFGWGTFDLDSELGVEAQRQVVKKLSNGVSLDLDKVSAEMLDIASAQGELDLALDDAIEDRPVTMIRMARNRAATLVALPAFEGARINAVESWSHETKPARFRSTLTQLAAKGTMAFAGIRIDKGGRWGVTVPKVGYRWVDMPDVALEKLDRLVASKPDGDAGNLAQVRDRVQRAFDSPDEEMIAQSQVAVQGVIDDFPFEDYENDVVEGFDDGEPVTGADIKQALEGFTAQDPDEVLEALEAKAAGDTVNEADAQEPDEDEASNAANEAAKGAAAAPAEGAEGDEDGAPAGSTESGGVEFKPKGGERGRDRYALGNAFLDVKKSEDSWNIDTVIVPEAERGQGQARALMERVIADADAEGKALTLEAWALDDEDNGPDSAALIKIYEKFGFELVDPESGAMRREPNAPAAGGDEQASDADSEPPFERTNSNGTPQAGNEQADRDYGSPTPAAPKSKYEALDTPALEKQRAELVSEIERNSRGKLDPYKEDWHKGLTKEIVEIDAELDKRGGTGEGITPEETAEAKALLHRDDLRMYETFRKQGLDHQKAMKAADSSGQRYQKAVVGKGGAGGTTAGNVSGPADDNAAAAAENPHVGKSPRQLRKEIALAEAEKDVWQGGDTKEASERTKLNRALKDEDIKDLTAALPEGEPTSIRDLRKKALSEDVDVATLEETIASYDGNGYVSDSDYKNRATLVRKLAEKKGFALGAAKDDGYEKVTDLGNGWTMKETDPKRTWGGSLTVTDSEGNVVIQRDSTSDYAKADDIMRAVGEHLYSAPERTPEGWKFVRPQYGGSAFIAKDGPDGQVRIMKDPRDGSYEVIEAAFIGMGPGQKFPDLDSAVKSVDGDGDGKVDEAEAASERAELGQPVTDEEADELKRIGVEVPSETAPAAATPAPSGDLPAAAEAAAREAQRIADESSLEQKERFEELAKLLAELPSMDPNVAAVVAQALQPGMGATPDMTRLVEQVQMAVPGDYENIPASAWEQGAALLEGFNPTAAKEILDSLREDGLLALADRITLRENWVEQTGGLPGYIREIADALMRKGMDESRAIATAVNTVKRWARADSAAKGGKGRVTASTVAKAQAALAEWEAKKAAAKATALQKEVAAQFGEGPILNLGLRGEMTDILKAEGVTLVASGAKADDAQGGPTMDRDYDRTSLVASGAARTALAAPIKPPKEWFADPKFRGATPLTVTKDGRVFGHLALWGTCHTGFGDTCVMVPKSASGYSLFHLGVVECEDGTEVAVGRLAMNTGHANDTFGSRKAIAHYENTGLAIADLRAGEDQYGVWVAGALRPDAKPEQIRALKASPLSGDWRHNPATNSLDLVMALAVNQPGFTVPRPKFLVASGAVRTLTAAGMLAPAKVSKIKVQQALAGDEAAAADIRYLQKLAADARRAEAKQLKVKVLERTGVRDKIREMAASLALTKEES